MNPVNQKNYIVDYVLPKTQKPLSQAISWYKDKLSIHPTAQKILNCLISGILILFSLGTALPLVCKIKDISFIIDQERAAKKFDKEIKEKIKNGEITPPPLDPIELKSTTKTFNYVEEYAIKDAILWHRPKKGTWEPLFFDGALSGRKPTKLSADGSNLIVIDDKDDVHYRKVLIEGRGQEQLQSARFQKHLKNHPEIQIIPDDRSTYVAIDKTAKINWKSNWFNFPIINRIINLVYGNKLFSPSGIISHRGRYNFGYEDAAGRLQESTIGVTTLYEPAKDGRSIQKHDPWSPQYSDIHLYFPETENAVFIASTIDVSASTILTFGYEIDTTTKKASLKILTTLCDIDTLGNDPLLHYSYDPKNKNARILPEIVENEGWDEHVLPSDAKEFFSPATIIQTGIGNKARELRIATRNNENALGYYKKSLQEHSNWEFIPSSHIDTTQILPLSKTYEGTIKQHVFSYSGSSLDKKEIVTEASLNHFGKHAYHSTLDLTINEKSYELQIHKRLGWRTFLGKKHVFYDLVIPQKITDPNLLQTFGGRRCIRININTKKQGVSITMSGKHPKIPLLKNI